MQVDLTLLFLWGGNNPINSLNGMQMIGLKQQIHWSRDGEACEQWTDVLTHAQLPVLTGWRFAGLQVGQSPGFELLIDSDGQRWELLCAGYSTECGDALNVAFIEKFRTICFTPVAMGETWCHLLHLCHTYTNKPTVPLCFCDQQPHPWCLMWRVHSAYTHNVNNVMGFSVSVWMNLVQLLHKCSLYL